MDFHSLSRKELQALCKKNKIPANMTNVAMADALAALHQVEGLDEFLNPVESDAQQLQEEKVARTPACRTSTRRKAVREEPESCKVSAKAGNAEGVEQENKDGNAPVTPAMPPSSRRRAHAPAPAVSTRRKKEDEKNEGQGKPTDVPITPAAPSTRTRAYNTRRSVRLLEKNLSKMSLMDAEDMGLSKIDDISKEMSNVSQQTQDSAETETEKGASLQTVSTVVSEKTDEFEVSSLENNTEYECQSHGSGSEVQNVSVTENDVGAGSEPQQTLGKVNCLESEAETHNSNEDSNEVRERCDESVVDLNKSIGEAVHADNEAGSELLSEPQDSCDSSEPENKECLGTKQDALSVEASEDAFMEVTEQDVAALSVEVPDDASMEVTDQDVAGSLQMSSVRDDSVSLKELIECNTDNQGSNEDGDNQDKNNETEHLNVADGSNVQNLEPTYDADEKAADEKDTANPEYVFELGSSKFCSSGEHQEEELEAKSKHSEESTAEIEEMDDASDVSILAVEKEASSENSIAVMEVCIENSEDESVDVENITLESSLLDVGVHKAKDHKDNSDKLEAKAQAGYSEEHAADEDQKYKSEKLEAEESKEHAAAAEEETALDAASAFPCALDGICSPQIPISHEQLSVESVVFNAGSSTDTCSSDAIMSVLSCNSNTLVDGDVISEEIAIPKQESGISAETVTVVSTHEQKASDIPIQSIVADQLKREPLCPAESEPKKGAANEVQTVPKSSEDDMMKENLTNMVKENLTADELQKRSIRELKKMLRNLTLDGKPNSKTNNVVAKEVERKRTALQALPENRMTPGEAQNDV